MQRQYYTKTNEKSDLIIERDSETGFWYRPGISGFAMYTPFLSEDNLRFIKILKKHNRLENNFNLLMRADITKIVNDLHYDSDLWDDIFDNNDIFRSVTSEEDIAKGNMAAMKESINFHMQSVVLHNYPLVCVSFEDLNKRELPRGIYLFYYENNPWVQVIHNNKAAQEKPINLSQMPGDLTFLTRIQRSIDGKAETIPEQDVETIRTKVGFNCQYSPLTSQFKSEADCKKFIRSRVNVFKFYVYLRRCAILYRDTDYKQPFDDLIRFIEKAKQPDEEISNYDWIKAKLRVKAVAFHDENWNTGLHEWLTCSQILEALKRTAGIVPDVESRLPECKWFYQENGQENSYLCSEFNWIDLQLLLRTPNKYVIFRSSLNTVENGHCGAVNVSEYPKKATSGVCKVETENAPSEDSFHNRLNELFQTVRTIKEFVVAIHQKYNISIFHDTTPIQASAAEKFLVDGTRTNDQPGLVSFQQGKLTEPHGFLRCCESDIDTHERIASAIEPRVQQQMTMPDHVVTTSNFGSVPVYVPRFFNQQIEPTSTSGAGSSNTIATSDQHIAQQPINPVHLAVLRK